ncbi:hypothetical protein SteCoe_35090 [Stentor coeruleus]|uniref:Rhodanese domain-containing protein n=1 Tax=Stentor coeruleus TaxID=5963 RepID=A0A1R2AT18_9CILI|nr:hypothetical protein SteCoe_35090 [Stentor coeruleus]
MNPFIALQECVGVGLDQYSFVYCSLNADNVSGYIEGSFLLVLNENTQKFINDVRSLEFPDGKIIVLYDSGDYQGSTKAYWGLKAAGFEPRLLLRINTLPDGVTITPGSPPLIKKSSSAYLPFNNQVALTKTDLEQKNSFFQQLVQINYIAFDITDADGQILPSNQILEMMKNSGIRFVINRGSIVFGKKAFLGGLLLAYVTGKSVSVVIDEIQRPMDVERQKSQDFGEVSQSLEIYDRKNSEEFNKAYDYKATIGKQGVSVDAEKKLMNQHKENRTKDTAICSNCVVV